MFTLLLLSEILIERILIISVFSNLPILFLAWLLCRLQACDHTNLCMWGCAKNNALLWLFFFSWNYRKMSPKSVFNLANTIKQTQTGGANLVSHPWCLKVFEKSRRMCLYLIRDSAVLSHEFGSSLFRRGVLQHLSYCVFVLNLKSVKYASSGLLKSEDLCFLENKFGSPELMPPTFQNPTGMWASSKRLCIPFTFHKRNSFEIVSVWRSNLISLSFPYYFHNYSFSPSS